MNLELKEVRINLKEAKMNYRNNTKEYLKLRRNNRKNFKPILDQSKEEYHKLELLENNLYIIELESQVLKENDNKKINKIKKELYKLKKKDKKLKSRLEHKEWLKYTRSIWPFKEMESNVKTKLHPAQFSAEIPIRCIKMFSYVDDIILDPFMGVGTTIIEAMKLKRKSIGVDINEEYVIYTKKQIQKLYNNENYLPQIQVGDARTLDFIKDGSIDLIVTHPPYFNAVKTSNAQGDLSHFKDEEYQLFLNEMDKVFSEFERIMVGDRVVVIVTGDIIRKINGITQLLPIHSDYINLMLKRDFVLWNIYIYETKMRKSGGKPTMASYPYPHKLLSQIAHNYVLVFRKKAMK